MPFSICSREIKRSISQKRSAAKLSERDFGIAISQVIESPAIGFALTCPDLVRARTPQEGRTV